MATLILPKNYQTSLNVIETQRAIKHIKDYFETNFSQVLHLRRVSAPILVDANSGLNDDLNGISQELNFDYVDGKAEIVHSLAKWKRMALYQYRFESDTGLYTDMNAIRTKENLDNIHSFYVDQWDWEKIITKENRTLDYLKHVVCEIYGVLVRMDNYLRYKYHLNRNPLLPSEIHFITSEELYRKYPNLTAKERERAIVKEYPATFLLQIGAKLSNGSIHDGRAIDYDDWKLNGDLLVYNPILDDVLELSSMGIRVDKEALLYQALENHQEGLLHKPYHQMILKEQLPYTIGGGIGQSRLCMFFLQKAHIGEVQASVWPKEMRQRCAASNIFLL